MAKKTIQIKNRYTEEIIFECEAESIKEAVEIAIMKKANLSEANLSEANLSEADLNCIFYNTKVNLSQRKYITEDTDLFKIVEESSSNLKENKVEKKE